MNTSPNTSRHLRFSIAFLLFVATCVAGGFAGYRAGMQYGYKSGRAKLDSEQPYPRVYQVGPLIRQLAAGIEQAGQPRDDNTGLDYGSLMGAIETVVFPEEWEALGGPCSMLPVPHSEALVVNATSGIHSRIAELVGDLETAKAAVASVRQEQRHWDAVIRAYRAKLMESLNSRVDGILTPLATDFLLDGKWDVYANKVGSQDRVFLYDFGDSDRVSVTSLLGKSQAPTEAWYSVLRKQL